ncbi:MAG: class I SAM-dependent methyltransferase [Gallionellaceae bacterium]
MKIADPSAVLIVNESDMLDKLLSLKDAAVLELGCGKAEKTRVVAKQAASVLALEVDDVQLAQNQTISDMPNVRFAHGGAEKIPAPDTQTDIVLMFKSLHHVPRELMDSAFAEIRRVLKPGGVAYISEPVYAGDFNDIIKLFHDEKVVREAAFAAEQRAIDSGSFGLVSQTFFLQPMRFESCAQFEQQVIGVSHTLHTLSEELLETVRTAFNKNMTADGAVFHVPIRVDLLQK